MLQVVASIPKGQTKTYGDVAMAAKHPGAARAVGAIMRSNTDKTIPCHRVVAKNGIGGYNGLRGKKEALLKKEGAL
ncbi:MAG: MGMT family protein [Patescibacteria group bacterium UBA2163]